MIKNWQLFLEELVGDKPISDLQDYIDGMNYTMSDKLFFIDKVNFDLIVDFGCAEFLRNFNRCFKDFHLILTFYLEEVVNFFTSKVRWATLFERTGQSNSSLFSDCLS